MKKIFELLSLFVWLIAGICGFGYCFYIGEKVAAFCCLVNMAYAFPTIRKMWKDLNS